MSVALTAKARVELQRRLDVIAANFDPTSDEARHRTLVSVVSLLIKYEHSIVYAFVESAIVRSSGAKGAFNDRVRSLRARYDYDTVKGDGEKPGPLHMRSEEGEGLVVVSVAVACIGKHDGIRSLDGALDARRAAATSLRELREIGARALVALEVVWSPSVDQDRLSSAELVVLYPELVRLRPNQLGRTRCSHCDCVFAAELGGCPVCGSQLAAEVPPERTAKPSSQRVRPCSHCKLPVVTYEVQCRSCGARARR